MAVHVHSSTSGSSANDSVIAVGDTPPPSSSASSSSSTNLKTWTTDPRDSCRWYGGIRCERPRTCYDCLNVQLPDTQCAVDPAGACVPISEYEASLRMRSNYTASYTYYPSTSFSYCAPSDAVCASCRSEWLQNASSSSSVQASSCAGVGDCVCVAYCEMPRWNESVLERNLCLSPSPSPAAAAGDDSIITSIDREAAVYKLLTALGIGLGLCAVFTVIALGVRYVVRVLEARAEEARVHRRRRPARVLRGPLLNLMGWKGMMEKLIEDEREHLAGDGGPRHVLSTEAPVVLVEAGDGYRPASPSGEHDRQRV